MKSHTSLQIVGWGNKFSGRRAKFLGSILRLRYIIKEDGFLRSISRNDEPLSELVDSSSAYYCADENTDLDKLIKELILPQMKLFAH